MVKVMNSTMLSINLADSDESYESTAETYKYAVYTLYLGNKSVSNCYSLPSVASSNSGRVHTTYSNIHSLLHEKCRVTKCDLTWKTPCEQLSV
jgi:hypothetical protein